jgi:hypothetical protein
MKLNNIKQEVYLVTCTKNTKHLKKERSDLTLGKDLRYKTQWQEILSQIKLSRVQNLDISINDLVASEAMLRQSLLKVGRFAGLSDENIKLDWQRIQLETQFTDVHIEEL